MEQSQNMKRERGKWRNEANKKVKVAVGEEEEEKEVAVEEQKGAAEGGVPAVVEWDDQWTDLWGHMVDEEMSWATSWCPFWEMEAAVNYDALYGDVLLDWDYDIWNLKAITANISPNS